jgi:serine/alanine adding enzyme
MSNGVVPLQSVSARALDRYAESVRDAAPYHLSAWREAITAAYGHQTVGAVATYRHGGDEQFGDLPRVLGLLALVDLRHWLFGSRYVSMPYCDWTGMLADDIDTERRLLRRVLMEAQAQRISAVEIRQTRPLDTIRPQREPLSVDGTEWTLSDANSENKVRMLLDLPGDADSLMRGFRSKLRSQIRKPMKEGLVVRSGGRDLVGDFYRVLVENMRDLGSPVHSFRFAEEVVERFGDRARVFVVYGDHLPIAGAVTLGLGNVLCNPWASASRRHVDRAPNMLLYWAMLEFACESGYRRFDFGRSTPNEGTYRFKEQWGARPEPIYWYRFSVGKGEPEPVASSKNRLRWAMECWKHMPVGITQVMGPMIRRHISL